MTEELVRNNMQRGRMLVEGSLSYDGLGEDPEWASCSHFLCIWNLEPNDSKCKAKHDLRRRVMTSLLGNKLKINDNSQHAALSEV